MNKQIGADQFIVNADTGKKIKFYECDPQKNSRCKKSNCKLIGRPLGQCDITTDSKAKATGSQTFYLYFVPGPRVKWSRVYIPPGPSRKKLNIKWAAIIFTSALLFLVAKDAAVKERGYTAFGGEYFILLLPFIYYVAERLIKDWIEILQIRCDENEL